jgi:hypothetical protein
MGSVLLPSLPVYQYQGVFTELATNTVLDLHQETFFSEESRLVERRARGLLNTWSPVIRQQSLLLKLMMAVFLGQSLCLLVFVN